MKPLALFSFLLLSLSAPAFARETPADDPPPAVPVHLDAPAGLALALAEALADRFVAVLPADAPATADAAVRLLPPAVTRVRSLSSDSPSSETLGIRRATLDVRDSTGRLLHSDTVAAPGSDPAVLVFPLADRIATAVLP